MVQEMKKEKIIIAAVFVCLVIVTVIASAVYLNGREKTPKNTVTYIYKGKEKSVDIDSLKLSDYSGTVVNGKGESREEKGEGIKLGDFVGTDDYSEITVTADDEYSATVKKDEAGDAWLSVKDGKLTLIVFGDENSKRNVKNVVKVEAK